MATDPIRALLTRAVAYDAQAAVRPPVADIEDIDGLQAALDGKADVEV